MPERRVPREVAETRKHGEAVILELQRVLLEAEDLFVLAHDKPVTGEQTRRPQPGPRDPSSGDRRAKDALKRLDAWIVDGRRVLAGCRDLLDAGSGVDQSLRGTFLDGQAELGRALAAQRRRKARGDYTPHPNFGQPKLGRS